MTPAGTLEGVLGLEGIHRWINMLDLNLQTGLPRIELDKITGLHSLPDADDERFPAVGRIGEVVYPGQPRGKTVVYEGRIIGSDLFEMRRTANLFRALFYNTSQEGTMVIRPHESVGGLHMFYMARVLSLGVDDDQTALGPDTTPTPFQRPFALSLRLSNPRIYHLLPVAVNTSPSVSVTVQNVGNAPTEPVWTIEGPIVGTLVFSRAGNPDARQLTFVDMDVSDGQTVKVDWARRTITRLSDGASYLGHMDVAESDWWDEGVVGLAPGFTSVRATKNVGTLSYFHANW